MQPCKIRERVARTSIITAHMCVPLKMCHSLITAGVATLLPTKSSIVFGAGGRRRGLLMLVQRNGGSCRAGFARVWRNGGPRVAGRHMADVIVADRFGGGAAVRSCGRVLIMVLGHAGNGMIAATKVALGFHCVVMVIIAAAPTDGRQLG